jgi:hypothetical protein
VIVNSTDERAEAGQLELNDLEVALIAPHVAKMTDVAADSASRHRYQELAAAISDRRLGIKGPMMICPRSNMHQSALMRVDT